MIDNYAQVIWVYLSASPLFGLALTIVAYLIGVQLYMRYKFHPLLNPVLIAIIFIIGALWLTKIDYTLYFEGAQFVHFLLGPATVALAVPLYQQFQKLKKTWIPLLCAIAFGSLTGLLSTIGIAWALGLNNAIILSLAPKSVTAPVAMGIAEKTGGLPTLTAVAVVLTGITGAMIGTLIYRLLRIRDDRIKGIAMGVSAHGIGTARAFHISQEMGAYSGLAMAASALITPLAAPWIIALIQS
ncbi:MAG: LrgB family protein [Gammaproteobacteria bacterium]|nr:LrgB family protein [Gammaproteobacteria bacterium]